MSACANSDEELRQITNPAEKLNVVYSTNDAFFRASFDPTGPQG